MILPIFLEYHRERPLSPLRHMHLPLLMLPKFLLHLNQSNLQPLLLLLNLIHVLQIPLLLLRYLHRMILLDLPNLCLIFEFKTSPEISLLSLVTHMECLDVSAVLVPELGHLLPVVLLLQLDLVLEIVDLSLKVQADFLHTRLQSAHFLLLELNDLLFLETDQGLYYLLWTHLHRLLGRVWLQITCCWMLGGGRSCTRGSRGILKSEIGARFGHLGFSHIFYLSSHFCFFSL
jgi:hypothetical protein